MIKRYKTGPRMSQAVAAGGTLYIAGQVADDGRASIEDQTREVLAKVDALLAEAGSEKAKIVADQRVPDEHRRFRRDEHASTTPGSTARTRRPAPASRPGSPIPTSASR